MRKIIGIAGVLLFLLVLKGQAEEPSIVVPEKHFPKAEQPQIAVDQLGKVYLVFGSGNAIFCTVSADGGGHYNEPIEVAEAGALALGMRRGPRVAATRKSVIVAAVGGKIGNGRDGDLHAWRSMDGGKTWQASVKLNRVPGSAREGLHHLAAGPDGAVFCVWLDLRAKRTEVYGIASSDGGAAWGTDNLIYQSPEGSVCECCQPQVAYDPSGGLHVMWRNHLAGSLDMYLIHSKDNGQSFGQPIKLGHGTWPLNACPMDGGGLAALDSGKTITIWRRGERIFQCIPGQPEISLGKGEQGWAAPAKEGCYLVWTVGREGPVKALLPGSNKPITLTPKGSDPVVSGPISGTGPVIAAWEEGEEGHHGARQIKAQILCSRPSRRGS